MDKNRLKKKLTKPKTQSLVFYGQEKLQLQPLYVTAQKNWTTGQFKSKNQTSLDANYAKCHVKNSCTLRFSSKFATNIHTHPKHAAKSPSERYGNFLAQIDSLRPLFFPFSTSISKNTVVWIIMDHPIMAV